LISISAPPFHRPGRLGIVDAMRVWVDQDRCTGDGLCVQYAPEVFEFDIDGLAYVKDSDGTLLTGPGTRTGVPERLRLEVLDASRECPGECIHLEPAAGPDPAQPG
jgi:ferredoxin